MAGHMEEGKMRSDSRERQTGQGLLEYALIILFVAIVVVGILTVFGTQLGNTYSQIQNAFP